MVRGVYLSRICLNLFECKSLIDHHLSLVGSLCIEALKLYIKVGEKDLETGGGALHQKEKPPTGEKINDAQKAANALAEKDGPVKDSIERKKQPKKSTPPPPPLASEPETATIVTGSASAALKRPSEEIVDSRKKAKESSPKLKKPKKAYVGDRVAKRFDDEVYFGTVNEFWYDSDDELELWRIVYDDDDTEDLPEDEFLEVLALYEKKKAGDPKQK